MFNLNLKNDDLLDFIHNNICLINIKKFLTKLRKPFKDNKLENLRRHIFFRFKVSLRIHKAK